MLVPALREVGTPDVARVKNGETVGIFARKRRVQTWEVQVKAEIANALLGVRLIASVDKGFTEMMFRDSVYPVMNALVRIAKHNKPNGCVERAWVKTPGGSIKLLMSAVGTPVYPIVPRIFALF